MQTNIDAHVAECAGALDDANDLYLAVDPHISAETLQELAACGDDAVLAAVARHPNAPLDILLVLTGRFPAQFCANLITPFLLLEHPNVLAEIAPDDLLRLLRYPGVPEAFLAWVVAHGTAEAAHSARLHVNYIQQGSGVRVQGSETFENDNAIRGQHNDSTVQFSAIGVIQTAVDHYFRATADDPPTVHDLLKLIDLEAAPVWLLEALAHSANLPTILRERLINNTGVSDACAVPTPQAPTKQPADEATLRRLALAADPGTPMETLARLADDNDPRVRLAVAHNPNASAEALTWLADDNHALVCRAVAAHPNAPPELLARLAADRSMFSARLRLNVARNPNTSTETLVRLSTDDANEVRHAVLLHPNTPPRTHEAMLSQALTRCAASGNIFCRIIALAHHTTPGDTLTAAVDSPHWLERYAVASNPNAPAQLLLVLAEDGNRVVRDAASGRRGDTVTADERRTTNDERRTTNDERRRTNDGGRMTNDGGRRTNDDG